MSNLEEVKKKMDFIGGQFLDNEAFPNDGVQVTVKAIKTEDVENPRTFKKEPKKVLYLEEFDQGMILGAKTNRKALIKLSNGKELKGMKITLYRDPTVKFGSKTIGAIRIR
jgi:hypothetical protein